MNQAQLQYLTYLVNTSDWHSFFSDGVQIYHLEQLLAYFNETNIKKIVKERNFYDVVVVLFDALDRPIAHLGGDLKFYCRNDATGRSRELFVST
tara:strand:+ start:48 stop:329 length:282 start_codon:yes stop_codon:yes gene_type:complete